MNPIVWIGLAVVLVAVVAFTGIAPKGGKPVARTRLMGTARSMLILGIVVFAALGVFGAIGH